MREQKSSERRERESRRVRVGYDCGDEIVWGEDAKVNAILVPLVALQRVAAKGLA